MSQTRQPGYYWVKYHNEWVPAEFIVGHTEFHHYQYWLVLGGDGTYYETEFDEIGERIEHK